MKSFRKAGLVLVFCCIILLLVTPPVAAFGSPARATGRKPVSFYKIAPITTWNTPIKSTSHPVTNGTSNRVPRIGTTASPDHFDSYWHN